MNGRDFLRTARRIASGQDESDWRSAVSRAYYAAFHATRDLLAALRFRTPRADRAHNYLYVCLNNSGDVAVQDAASLLSELRRVRNQADYDVGLAFQVGDSIGAVTHAEQVLQTIDSLTGAVKKQITDAMKLYEKQIGDVTWQP